jgi:thiol-disulfide isomerase/thioredoxin
MIFLFSSKAVFAFENADFVVKTLDEKNFDIKKFHNQKKVLISFWAEWCGECVYEILQLEKLHKKCSSNVAVIGVSIDPKKAQEKVLERIKNTTYPNAFFVDVIRNNFPKITSVPTLYLVDKSGAATEINEVPTCMQLK